MRLNPNAIKTVAYGIYTAFLAVILTLLLGCQEPEPRIRATIQTELGTGVDSLVVQVNGTQAQKATRNAPLTRCDTIFIAPASRLGFQLHATAGVYSDTFPWPADTYPNTRVVGWATSQGYGAVWQQYRPCN